ncbi:hypothetical protein [Bacillus horti]|uniref:YrzI family small protein n=1 Tax=Caldalkalibacillus horti TaxID=77523 RepID=A0ABT9VV48_9BACI|nr:hypothetical protein [Bacillus horti]MDQ0164702.1 hypothetical protein [Bacillus horti]
MLTLRLFSLQIQFSISSDHKKNLLEKAFRRMKLDKEVELSKANYYKQSHGF